MTESIEKKTKRSVLKRILESETFSGSHTYQEFFTYLVEANIAKQVPKEYAVATDVFHKSPDFNPANDTIVRVYAYNLRKKLDEYYKHEGVNEKIRIVIPKGHYQIDFEYHRTHWITARIKWITLLTLLLLFFVTTLFLIYRLYTIDRHRYYHLQSDVWQDFFNNGNPKKIVLGDHFFFVKDSHSRADRTIMRRDDINSRQDFDNYKSLQPERQNLVQLRFPMFPRNSVWPFADMVTVFNHTKTAFEIDYASNVSAKDFKQYDLIFIGSFHTLASFDQTFHHSGFIYNVYPNRLVFTDQAGDTLYSRVEQGDPVYNHIDFGVVRKIPGPENKIIFIFTSFHETGTAGIVSYFTHPETIAQFEKMCNEKFGHVPKYFELLFNASGYNRTVFTTEIEYIAEVDKEEKFW
ncbi:hypothetical protein JW935_00355 [candidate division KSB1 bacterium]|nr:hypothetical protein [candidate division KSB1 bacterium]